MESLHVYAVEFVGGPLDGHKHVATEPPDRRPETLALPINRHVLALLDGAGRLPSAPISSVAWYVRESNDGVWQYQFLGATAPGKPLTLARKAQ
jgi:hypothetical protein